MNQSDGAHTFDSHGGGKNSRPPTSPSTPPPSSPFLPSPFPPSNEGNGHEEEILSSEGLHTPRKEGLNLLRTHCDFSDRNLASVIEEDNADAEEMSSHDTSQSPLANLTALEINQLTMTASSRDEIDAHHFRFMSDLTNQEEDNAVATGLHFDNVDVEGGELHTQQPSRSTRARTISWSFDMPPAYGQTPAPDDEEAEKNVSHISLHDINKTMDQQVEAAIIQTLEREQSAKLDHTSNQDHAAGERTSTLNGITDEVAQHFLKHQEKRKQNSIINSPRFSPKSPTSTHSPRGSASKQVQRKFFTGTETNSVKKGNITTESKDEELGMMGKEKGYQNPPENATSEKKNTTKLDQDVRNRTKENNTRPPRHVARPTFANLVLDMQQMQNGESLIMKQYKSLRRLESKDGSSEEQADKKDEHDKTDDVDPDTIESQTKEAIRKNQVAPPRDERSASSTDLFYKNAAKVFKHSRDASIRASANDLNKGEHDPFLGSNFIGVDEIQKSGTGNDVELPSAPGEESSETSGRNVGSDERSSAPWRPFSAFRKGFNAFVKYFSCRTKNCCIHAVFRSRQIFHPRDLSAALYYSKLFIGIVLAPLLGVATILYYVFDNPLTVRAGGSVSWWFILTVRWALTLTLAKIAQCILLDFICLRSSIALDVFGPLITLTLAQSKGWPFQLTFWGVFNFSLLYGNNPFTNHWLYYQPWIAMFNANNQAATFLSNHIYRSILITFLVVGVFTSLKRTAVSIYLGRRTCEFYGPQLEKIVQDIIMISSVAQLAKEIERDSFYDGDGRIKKVGHLSNAASPFYVLEKNILQPKMVRRQQSEDSENEEEYVSEDVSQSGELFADEVKKSSDSEPRSLTSSASRRHASNTRKLLKSHRGALLKYLDQWEEPVNILEAEHREDVSIQEILHFRNAMNQLKNDFYPFSQAFGPANDRKACLDSAQAVYSRLMMHTPKEESLPFETISIVGLDGHGNLDEIKTNMLVRTFRPNGNGKLSLLDFAKCCDDVYKRYRTFRAAVANSSVVNNAYERIIDGVFYFLLAIVVLIILRVDVWALLVSFSTLVVSFAFAFGSAVSKFTEGVLLVVVRKPFDIGDRVHVSDPNMDTPPDGTAAWFVENITLFATTFRFATTNEVCTIANGNLANSRIINAARSPRMLCYVFMKFGIEVPYEKVMFFKKIAEKFVKERPREWLGLVGFRATRIQADQGFIEYVLVLQHRLSWQDIVPMLDAKAEFSSFCLEVSKKLNMRYVAPPLPVELGFEDGVTPPPWVASNTQDDEIHPTAGYIHSPGHKKSHTLEESSAAMRAVQEMFSPPKSRKR